MAPWSSPATWGDAGRDLVLGTACLGCRAPGRTLCAACDAVLPRAGVLAWPTPPPPGLAPPFAGGEYDGVLRALVNAHKERGALALATPLGRVLGDVVGSLLAAADWPPGAPVHLVPVPSRRAVVRRRGHDPLLRITRAATTRLRSHGVPAAVACLLVAGSAVRDQAGLGAEDRATNLAGSMRATRSARRGRPPGALVLVDDVLTTGSTAREAQRALEAASGPVLGIATAAATRRRLVAAPPFP